jgi:hypothetical protein
MARRNYRCRECGNSGHNRSTCPTLKKKTGLPAHKRKFSADKAQRVEHEKLVTFVNILKNLPGLGVGSLIRINYNSPVLRMFISTPGTEVLCAWSGDRDLYVMVCDVAWTFSSLYGFGVFQITFKGFDGKMYVCRNGNPIAFEWLKYEVIKTPTNFRLPVRMWEQVKDKSQMIVV